MNINFNFCFSKDTKINGDVRYQIDAISLLKKNNVLVNLGNKGFDWFISTFLRNISNLLLRVPIISTLFNCQLNYFSRKLSLDFRNKNLPVFSHYFFTKVCNNSTLIWSTQGIMEKNYYSNYSNLSKLKSDIKLYKKIDSFGNTVFVIWDKKFALRTKKLCNLHSPIKVITPSLNYNEKKLISIKTKVKKKINLLFIGLNPEIKGLNYLHEAINDKLFDNYDFKLRVITHPTNLKNTKKISYHSDIKEHVKRKYLKECDIFILPTTAETFGYSILEAISYKCAIITTDFYPLTNFCLNDYNGLLVRNKNSHDIKIAISKMFNSQKKIEIYKKNSFKLYKKKFSQKIYLDKMMKLSKNIILKKVIKSDI